MSSPNDILHSEPRWRKLYEAAVLEADCEVLPRRIDLARKAIKQRVERLLFTGENGETEPKARAVSFQIRQAGVFAKAMKSRHHPVVAHIIPIRRCNLACSYCNEFDSRSSPVPLELMLRRIDRLAELGTTVITISGGEPLLHPELDRMIRQIRRRGSIATLITNGYLLTPDRIHRLNRAGLDHLQISIDNVQPDDTSMKSLKVLDTKLQWLAQHASFLVNINSVIGMSRHPEEALVVARRARALGCATTVGIVHDREGQLRPLGDTERRVYEEIAKTGWCTTVHSSGAVLAFRLTAIRLRTWIANTTLRSRAHRSARSLACTKFQWSISFERSQRSFCEDCFRPSQAMKGTMPSLQSFAF